MTPVIVMPVSVSEVPAATKAVGFPELPVLSAMLHGARRLRDAADWRSGVLAALAMPDADGQNMAKIAACGLPSLTPGTGICLALPVHVVAGTSRMFMASPGSFVLDAARRDELRRAFNAEFGSTDLQLHAVGSGWLLQAPFAAAANDGSPESLVGDALAREPAVSTTGRSLRRLGAEIEMWLAALPFNAERERRSEPPINSFWFWSGGTTEGMPAPGHAPGALFTNGEPDAWMAGLAHHCGLAFRHASTWQEVRDTPDAVVILQPPLPGDAMALMPAWESAWLDPARRDLAARRLPELRLQIGGSTWQLPAPRLARWFRRARPWWQSVQA
jgi:hypothetical protein